MPSLESSTNPGPPPPIPQRRPRVREVSSRFMSPLIPSPSPSDPHIRSKTVQHHRDYPDNLQPSVRRSFDTPKSVLISSINHKHHTNHPKSRQKLFKENGDPQKLGHNNIDFHQKLNQSQIRTSISRSDTPNLGCTDRIVPSRYKQSTNQLRSSFNGVSDAARLLQEATGGAWGKCSDDMAVLESRLKRIEIREGEDGNQQPKSCPNSPVCVVSNKLNAPSTCSRSLEFRGFNGEIQSSRGVLKAGVLPLPPHPKMGSLRGKKGGVQEDVHSLKMMQNHLLQWRFANAKAEASMQAQKTEAEQQLYSLGSNIAGLRDAVERKRMELARLQRITTLSTILQGHMPILDKWSDLEEDYSSSLSGMTNALLNASLRVPVGGEVRQVDVSELRDIFDSASNVMEMVGSHIQSFTPEAEEADSLSSELARVAAGEKALVEECGSLTLKMHASQVNEWSLRGHIIQVKGTRTIVT